MPPSRPSGQRVYVIQHELGPVKIGIAEQPRKRLDELQVGSPFELKLRQTADPDDAREVEKYLHRRFRMYRLNGEWFDLPPELREFDIPTMITDGGTPSSKIPHLDDKEITKQWVDGLTRFFRAFRDTRYIPEEIKDVRASVFDLDDADDEESSERNNLSQETDLTTALEQTPDDKKRCSQCGHLFDQSHGECPTCSSGDLFDGGRDFDYRR